MDILDPLALPAATALMVATGIVIHNYQIPTEITGFPELYSVLGKHVSMIKDSFIAHTNEPALILDSLARVLEKMFMIDTKQSREEQMNGSVPKASLQSGQSKLDKLINPPARTALLASIIFILSAQYIYEQHQADRYQYQFLYVGLVIGFNTSAVAYIISADNLFSFKTFVPASVAAALVLSSLAHRFVIPKKVGREKKDQ